MHDRAFAPRSRRRSLQQTAALSPFGSTSGAAPEGHAGSDSDHVGIPHILTRRARWMTSRLRQR
ncbi:hypothetical protein ACEZCY_16290 [Streptacidiphilus sp. N1-12]|uniref:Uncharacterized protein n=3 Tax=Streptacidiphilus alkalitolerans TaxID=3342712 RepID=A0ABV6VAN7_9ACTN